MTKPLLFKEFVRFSEKNSENLLKKCNKISWLFVLILVGAMFLADTSISTYATDEHIDITGKNIANIQTELQSTLDQVSSGERVTVTGSKADEEETIILNIPAGVTLEWSAKSEDLAFDLDGGGTFEVAMDGQIEVTGERTIISMKEGNVAITGGEISAVGEDVKAIYVKNGDVIVTEGEIAVVGQYSTAVEVDNGNIKVFGGEISADADENTYCYALSLNESGTIVVMGGKVSAMNSFYEQNAIFISGEGIAAYLTGTCQGDFNAWGNTVIVKVASLDIPSTYGGKQEGLTLMGEGKNDNFANVVWNMAAPTPTINYDSFAIEWGMPQNPPSPISTTDSVKLQETNVLFDTLNEGIAAAKALDYSTFTLEIIGSVEEGEDIFIPSGLDVTILGKEGNHTLNLAPGKSINVETGGSLTLGDGTETDLLTISRRVDVLGGEIIVKHGVLLQSGLSMKGKTANGNIFGGRFEGTVALSLEAGATLDEIEGGVFIGKQDAVHLTDINKEGTKINRISGGLFYQNNAYEDTTLHGHTLFVDNYAQIGEISGGYFEAEANCALIIIRGGWVEEISGGVFVPKRIGSIQPKETRNTAIWIISESFPVTGIGTISDADIRGTNFGILLSYAGAQIGIIKGGKISGEVALQNDFGGVITEISGGIFTGKDHGILNVNEIKTIGGTVQLIGAENYGIYNYSGGRIDEIRGGRIVGLAEDSCGIANSGTIKVISGGTIIGGFNAIDCNGFNKGTLEKITGGIFWGRNYTAICLSSEMDLEPDLNTAIGVGRFWGGGGNIFNDESFVVYPLNSLINISYEMSTDTVTVADITVPGRKNEQFKYLRLPGYILTYDVNGGVENSGPVDEVFLSPENDHPLNLVTVPIHAKANDRSVKFIGWTADRDIQIYEENATIPAILSTVDIIDQDVTVYALWGYDKEEEKGGGKNPSTTPPETSTTEPESPFIDDHFAYVIGYPDGTVHPETNVTRAEVATVFFRLLTDELREANWELQNPFAEINSGDWYNSAVSVMHHMKIVKGYPDGSFRANDAITRAELATIAIRFAAMMEMKQTNSAGFSDISEHWAAANIIHAAEIGWVDGYPDGTYRPERNITRAEFMALVNRMLERVPEMEEDLLLEEMTKWPDNADARAWYYLVVQEATNSHVPEYKSGEIIPGRGFEYEYWVAMMPDRDWSQIQLLSGRN